MILETLLLPRSMFTQMTEVSPDLPQVTGGLCFRKAPVTAGAGTQWRHSDDGWAGSHPPADLHPVFGFRFNASGLFRLVFLNSTT